MLTYIYKREIIIAYLIVYSQKMPKSFLLRRNSDEGILKNDDLKISAEATTLEKNTGR